MYTTTTQQWVGVVGGLGWSLIKGPNVDGAATNLEDNGATQHALYNMYTTTTQQLAGWVGV